jgi:hypothetical protein
MIIVRKQKKIKQRILRQGNIYKYYEKRNPNQTHPNKSRTTHCSRKTATLNVGSEE